MPDVCSCDPSTPHSAGGHGNPVSGPVGAGRMMDAQRRIVTALVLHGSVLMDRVDVTWRMSTLLISVRDEQARRPINLEMLTEVIATALRGGWCRRVVMLPPRAADDATVQVRACISGDEIVLRLWGDDR